MASLIGVEIASGPSTVASATLDSNGNIEVKAVPFVEFAGSLLEICNESLLLNDSFSVYPNHVDLNYLLATKSRGFRDAVAPAMEDLRPDRFCVAIPSATVPSIREILSTVLSLKPNDYVAIESPIAAYLEWAATRHACTDAFVITRGNDAPEVSLVRVDASSEKLKLQVAFTREIPGRLHDKLMGCPAASTDCHLIAVGKSGHDFASELASHLELDQDCLVVMPDDAVQRGASRYAAYIHDKNLKLREGFHGTEFSEIRVERCWVPWDLGIISSNRSGDQYWSRMSFDDGGAELFTCDFGISRPSDTNLWLSVIPASLEAYPNWLIQPQWSEARLRFFHQVPWIIERTVRLGIHLGRAGFALWRPNTVQVS